MNSYKFDDKEAWMFYNEITGKKNKSARRDVTRDFSSASEKANILSALKIRLINAGKYNEAISGRLTRDMRTFVHAVESVINGKPNEFARYLFA